MSTSNGHTDAMISGAVPPLFCPSGGSSECSSSEDSATGPYASEHSDPRLQRDDGYEADVEIGKLDFLASIKMKNVIDPLSALDAVTSSPNGACFDVECPEYDRHGELAHPELCVIVVDIVSQLIDGLLGEKCSVENRNKSVEELERVCAGLARAWGAGAEGEGADTTPGDSPPLLGRLLAPRAPATRLLSQQHKDLQDLQRAVLSLVVGAARRRLSARDLSALLRLFAAPRPPLTPLLRALQRLLTQQRSHAPDHELLFPISLTPEPDELPVDESVASSFSQQAEIQSHRLHMSHLSAGVVSPWAVGAVRCAVDGAGWAPWAQGFAVVAWLQLQPPIPAKDEAEQWLDDMNEPVIRGTPRGAAIPMHVLSVGHDSLMFELWTDLNSGIVSVRLSRPEARVNRIVSGARSTCTLPLRRTTCLAFDVRERVAGRRIHLHVTVYIDGRECETILLPVQGILVRKPTPVNVVFGHASANGAVGAGTLRVASVRVYRAPVLSPPAAAHVAAHGPNQPCQVGCESPDFSSIITPEILEMGLDWDQVYELPSNILRELHEQQLLALSAHAPDHVLLYPQYSPAPTVWGGRPSSGGAGEPPRTLRCSWAGPPRVSVHRGFAPALLLLGGPDLLLYLFARVVELEGSAEEQAAALSLLLRSCALDARLAAALHAAHSLRLLLPVFAAPNCRLSAAMLQVILSEACNAPVLTGVMERGSAGNVERKAGHVVLNVDTQALLVEPRLIKLLFRAWRNFETAQVSWDEAGLRYTGTAWGLTLACVRALLRRDHPHADFNRYQAARADLLRQLLLTTKERFLNSECGGMDEHASDCLVGVARALLTGSTALAAAPAPPALNELALLADFLLLMHQASDTFVTHTRATFYFLLSYDTPETSEFNFLKFIGKRARANFAAAENPSDLPLNDMGDTMDRNAYRDSESDKTDDSGVESTKRLKGIINQKIREDRRSISTSTSDNSDSVLEEKKELDNDVETETEDERKDKEKEVQNDVNTKEDALNGFVVVNENDINENPTNVNENSNPQPMVSSMSGVRAGAEPGWRACEGLLLLLRDALAALPKDQLAQAVTAVVQPELVAVLANHRTASVRAAVVRVARELMRRAPINAQAPTSKLFYSHLANQISLYGVSSSLAEACCALLTDVDVPLSEQLDAKIWAAFAEENAMRAAPLLALLPLAIRDVPLAHNLVAVLRRFVDKVSTKTISEVALVEVVVRAIRALGREEQEYEGKELILEDLSDLLNRIAIKTLAGNNSMQSILDTHLLLRYIECEAGGDEGAEGGADGAGVRGAARAAQAALYAAQLDALQQRLRRAALEPVRRPTYFTNVLSSAVERSEVADTRARIAAVQTRAVAFLTTRERDPPQPTERALFCRLLDMLLHECSNDSGGGGRRGGASGALSDLFWWAATPSVIARPLQPDLLRALYRAPPIALAHLVPHNRDPTSLRKLAVYLLTLLRHVHLEAERGGSGVELAITDWARDWAVGSQAALAERLDSEALPAEAERLRRADRARRLANAPRRRAAIGKAVFAREAQARALAEAAMAATRLVVDTQNAERKAFLEQLKASSAASATAAARWQRIVNAHTHERGVWYDEHAAPASWQLDDVEGPGRVRVRLRRAHLRIPERFLKPPYKYKSQRALAPPPLRSVVGAGGGGGAAARLAAGEAVQHTARVRRVTVALAAAGELLLTDRRLHWVPEEPAEPLCLPLRSLAAVATRRWCLRECALELFLRSGRAHLLAFEDQAERSAFLKQLARAHLPERTEQENLTDAMNQWRVGAITNWEYLMILNGLAGRSYNDLMQYPVLPFVIADYTSKILDLTDPASFRDLSRPMAIQNRNREQHYINTYNDLAAARRDGCSPLLSRWPHHYASLYSNSGGVLHYLVRLPPFTELFLNYQDNNFDMPDRTFHSLATTWRLITNDSPTDVKELIPELFYLPELFYNNEGLELGVRQCGLPVDSVQLPQWAADARLFTLVHRQALEAPAVTERLPLWIDLVFGYKQTGQAAIDAINVFPACTYYGFDPSALEHQVDRDAADAMVRTYGQAPRQLLRQPHPQRAPDLAPPPPMPSAQVYAGAVGARWGRYCGSPERPAPREVGRRTWSGVTRLQPLAHARSVAAAPHHTMLLLLRDEWAAPGDVENETLCAVSWGHADGLLRLRRRRDLPPEPLLQLPHIEQVTSTCGWSGGGGGEAARGAVGALGLSSGRVLALRVRGGPVPRLTAVPLLAHAAPVAALALCPRAGLLVSASDDGVIVLWDLDELTYIRTLPNRGRLSVQCLAISETLSDVCSAHEPPPPLSRSTEEAPDWLSAGDAYDADADTAQPDNADSDAYERDDTYKYRTLLRVHTVNGRFVGSVKVIEGVTCMQYSNAPEGASANCVAAALRSGGIRLYSSWELRPVAYIPPPNGAPAPMLSLAYGGDSSLLFSCYADGTVLAWESLDAGARPQPLRIVSAHALL
ncbi:lysosomal-trafficking regulator isoform X2 [Aricia agestis]|uniref:lysosomal-trafficking regulator isoform X2 n=1 Tax=Aricia agestis TaxID=91739 RepID=UPI001C2085EC|nr:lysosomal-trafficking regulator isoform X2 [Aricia agestis]